MNRLKRSNDSQARVLSNRIAASDTKTRMESGVKKGSYPKRIQSVHLDVADLFATSSPLCMGTEYQRYDHPLMLLVLQRR
jgi:hypothetical protein